MNIEQAIDILKNSIADYVIGEYCEKCADNKICDDRNEDCYYQQAIDIVVTAYEKEKEKNKELKEDRKKYAEEYIHNNPWLYKQLNENYILRVESEQKERGAYIKGTNDADELCNKKWEDKIKEKVIKIKNKPVKDEFITASQGKLDTIIEIESLLERK